MASKRRSRVWFRLNIHSVQWRVQFGNLKGTPEVGVQGQADYDKATITISWNVGREKVYETLWHELGHAVADASGSDRLIASLVPNLSETAIVNHEELFMRTFNQGMFAAMMGAGILRFPPVPDWL